MLLSLAALIVVQLLLPCPEWEAEGLRMQVAQLLVSSIEALPLVASWEREQHQAAG